MATYATQADLEAYIDGLDVSDPAGLEKIIQRAERDIDDLFGPYTPLPATGLKLDPSLLEQWERDALADAVAAQAEHRIILGEAAIAAAPGRGVTSVRGPDFARTYGKGGGAPKRYGPKVASEMSRLRHLRPMGVRAYS